MNSNIYQFEPLDQAGMTVCLQCEFDLRAL